MYTLRTSPPIAGCFFCVFVLSMLHLLHYIVWNIYLTSQEVDFSMMFDFIFFSQVVWRNNKRWSAASQNPPKMNQCRPRKREPCSKRKSCSKQHVSRVNLLLVFGGDTYQIQVGFLPYLFYHSGREHDIQAILSQLFKCPIRNLKSLSEDVWSGIEGSVHLGWMLPGKDEGLAQYWEYQPPFICIVPWSPFRWPYFCLPGFARVGQFDSRDGGV